MIIVLSPAKTLDYSPSENISEFSSPVFLTKSKNLINHGVQKNNKVNYFGYVSRLDNLQALFLNHQMKKLGNNIKTRRKNARIFNSELSNFVQA